MASYCIRTDAGRAEVHARALAMPRTARNLLLIVDATRPADEWVALVHGASADDLARLVELGLVRLATPPGPTVDVDLALGTAPAPAPAAASMTSGQEMSRAPTDRAAAGAQPPGSTGAASNPWERLDTLGYDQLYELLTAQAKERFGLLKGYRLVLEVERCSGLPELQALARRFLQKIQAEQGEVGLRPMRLALGLAG